MNTLSIKFLRPTNVDETVYFKYYGIYPDTTEFRNSKS